MSIDTFETPMGETQATEPINVGESAPSFDDLDNAGVDSDIKEPAPKKESKTIPNEGTEPLDSKPEKKEKPSKEVGEKTKEEIKEEAAEEIRKMIKASYKNGDEEAFLDIPEDAIFTQKVDGKEVQVPLSELRTNYSGKVAWDKRFSELDTLRKTNRREYDEYYADREQLMGNLGKFKELVDEGNHMDALYQLVDLSGGNRHNFYMGLRKQLLPDMEEYLSMTEEERAVYDSQLENDMLKSQVATFEERQKQLEMQQHQQVEINQMRQARNISVDEFNETDLELKEMLRDGQLPDMEDISPDFVCDFIQSKKNIEVVTNVVSQIDSSLMSDNHFVNELLTHMLHNPDTTEEDISFVANHYLGIEEKKQIINKKTTERVVRKPVHNPMNDEDSFFSDYDEDNMQTIYN